MGGTLSIDLQTYLALLYLIIKRNLYATLDDLCIRVSFSKSSCEETPEEFLRVNCQSLRIHLLTDQSNSTGVDRQTQPDQSRHSAATRAKIRVSQSYPACTLVGHDATQALRSYQCAHSQRIFPHTSAILEILAQ